jgi:hypothetical protein
MNAGETLETEFVGAVPAVPHARLHHLKPPLWPLTAAPSQLLVRRLDCRFFAVWLPGTARAASLAH